MNGGVISTENIIHQS